MDPRVRPVVNPYEPVVVSVALALRQIFKLVSQVFITYSSHCRIRVCNIIVLIHSSISATRTCTLLCIWRYLSSKGHAKFNDTSSLAASFRPSSSPISPDKQDHHFHCLNYDKPLSTPTQSQHTIKKVHRQIKSRS